MNSFENIKVEHRGPVDWVTMNRPESLNSLTGDMAYELWTYFQEVGSSEETRVIVLRGEGEGFCSGIDLKSFMTGKGSPEKNIYIKEVVKAMWSCPLPVVSLVHGVAIGAGFSFALASDIRIAGESARMRVPFIKLGVAGSELGTGYFLPRMVGASVAAELSYTGNFLKADRALQLGLVSNVVPDSELESAATELVDQMVQSSRSALSKTKEMLQKGMAVEDLDAIVDLESYTNETLAKTPEFKKAMGAFMKKKS